MIFWEIKQMARVDSNSEFKRPFISGTANVASFEVTEEAWFRSQRRKRIQHTEYHNLDRE